MLIEKIKSLPAPSDMPTYNAGYIKGIMHAIHEAQQLLPTERTQIEEAFDKGTSNGINIATRTGTTYKKASDYFTKKYKDGE